MAFEIIVPKRVQKSIRKLPQNVQDRFIALAQVLYNGGPTGPHYWQNYSKLGENEYHCHLTYHYVACWRYEKNTITIEVQYVGSRENAPY
jgi:mRNA-degrading endonuclease RelE of RelBE toxin-antitoxin system